MAEHERAVFALLSRITGRGPHVDDLAQDTFMKAFLGLPRFDPEGPGLLSTWLLTIATRVAIDQKRKRARDARVSAPQHRPLRPARVVGGVLVGVALAAGITLFVRGPTHGEISADQRKEVTIGHRATLVLEPGAKIHWLGDDVTQERGEVFYRVDRALPSANEPSPAVLDKLGLAPGDGPIIVDAMRTTSEWLSSKVRPACMQIVGKQDLVDKLSPASCAGLAMNILQATDDPELEKALQATADIKSGARLTPREGEKIHPLQAMTMALTGANEIYEARLAEKFGPEEAHRIVFAEGMCRSRSTWSGFGKPKP